ncbi:hypothetical protein N7486_001868 [Penicillium sp. IBT 16267x]|nr:hypothetical protein N7486_001868 [Penicillium sp. IBT 16267x]
MSSWRQDRRMWEMKVITNEWKTGSMRCLNPELKLKDIVNAQKQAMSHNEDDRAGLINVFTTGQSKTNNDVPPTYLKPWQLTGVTWMLDQEATPLHGGLLADACGLGKTLSALNPRRFLSAEDLRIIREMFPSAIGARVFVSGFIVILFNSMADIKRSWDYDGPCGEFGNRRLRYDIIEHTLTRGDVLRGAPIVPSPDPQAPYQGHSRPRRYLSRSHDAHATAGLAKPYYTLRSITDNGIPKANVIFDKPYATELSRSLGLKIRFSDGREAITVPTHAFVRLRSTNSRISPWN